MTQDPQWGEHPGPDGGSTPPQPPADGHGQLPDYRPTHPAGPGPIPGTGQYAKSNPTSTSTVVLTIISGILTLSGICCVVGLVPLILGVLALTQASTDPGRAATLTRVGWVVLVGLTILVLLAIVGAVFFVATGDPSGGGYV